VSDEVLSALLEIKDDLGQLKAGQIAIHDTLTAHSSASASAHTRITQLEMARERQKGMTKALHVTGIALGTLSGYVSQGVVGWFKSRGHL
jgi:hypothetical protein